MYRNCCGLSRRTLLNMGLTHKHDWQRLVSPGPHSMFSPVACDGADCDGAAHDGAACDGARAARGTAKQEIVRECQAVAMSTGRPSRAEV